MHFRRTTARCYRADHQPDENWSVVCPNKLLNISIVAKRPPKASAPPGRRSSPRGPAMPGTAFFPSVPLRTPSTRERRRPSPPIRDVFAATDAYKWQDPMTILAQSARSADRQKALRSELLTRNLSDSCLPVIELRGREHSVSVERSPCLSLSSCQSLSACSTNQRETGSRGLNGDRVRSRSWCASTYLDTGSGRSYSYRLAFASIFSVSGRPPNKRGGTFSIPAEFSQQTDRLGKTTRRNGADDRPAPSGPSFRTASIPRLYVTSDCN